MSKKAIIEALGFTIDPSDQMARCLRHSGGGVRPATDTEKRLWDVLNGATTGDGQGSDTTPVSTELVKFLRGEHKLEGLKFGDKLDSHPEGDLWWRDLLPAAEIEQEEDDMSKNTNANADANQDNQDGKPTVATDQDPGELKVVTTAPVGDVDNQPALGSLQPAAVADAAAEGNVQTEADDLTSTENADALDRTKDDANVVTQVPHGAVDHQPALGALKPGATTEEANKAANATAKPVSKAKSTSSKK